MFIIVLTYLQESLWQQALDDIQREIEAKLDKVELSPVREFFNSKLKHLQENLKQIISMRRETEAAGTKKKLLKYVISISVTRCFVRLNYFWKHENVDVRLCFYVLVKRNHCLFWPRKWQISH